LPCTLERLDAPGNKQKRIEEEEINVLVRTKRVIFFFGFGEFQKEEGFCREGGSLRKGACKKREPRRKEDKPFSMSISTPSRFG
jgi:hypothetical protein